ncbi:MAG: CPBP family intramembrane glutamic endopeptidase [Terracidiphilus sp.]
MTHAVMHAEVGSHVAPSTSERRVIIVAWIITILLSSAPNILWQETMHRGTPWLFRGKLMLVLALLAFSAFVRLLRPLAPYATVFLAILSLERLGQLTMDAPAFLRWFTGNWGRSMMGMQLIRLGATGTLIAVVWLLVRSRRRAFLRLAMPGAQARPVWYLPIRKPIAWSLLGPPMAFFIALGTLTFVLIAGRPDDARVRAAVPLFPLILLLAAMNSFSEEFSYRASLLATLRSAVGDRNALLLTATFFGLAHYYGVPYGVIGVCMSGCLGYVLGRAMLESEGMLWPWFIHFLQDVVIFSFLAIGAVRPGGG